jgi:hypothetical protein
MIEHSNETNQQIKHSNEINQMIEHSNETNQQIKHSKELNQMIEHSNETNQQIKHYNEINQIKYKIGRKLIIQPAYLDIRKLLLSNMNVFLYRLRRTLCDWL